MSTVFNEFLDENLHRIYPLTDDSGGVDTSGSFTLPGSLITDIFLCVPNISAVDISSFFISYILIKDSRIDIAVGYDDPATPNPIGVFKNIAIGASPHTCYNLTPLEVDTGTPFDPLYHSTGQIIIGDTSDAIKNIGKWYFDQSSAEKSTKIIQTRVSKGLLNVQYISVNDTLFTGVVKLKEGANISLNAETNILADGTNETVITVSASLSNRESLQLNSDEDVLNALIDRYGVPIQTVNGMFPDSSRNFSILGADCTEVANGSASNITISNPCSTVCCEEDPNITNLLQSVGNLNERYATLKSFYDAAGKEINLIQNKLLSLGSEV